MNIKIEILFSSILSLSVIIGAIRTYLFKKQNDGLMLGVISMLSIMFGVYLWIKNGLILDYGTEEKIVQTNAQLMSNFGTMNVLIGSLFIIISILKYFIWKIKNARA